MVWEMLQYQDSIWEVVRYNSSDTLRDAVSGCQLQLEEDGGSLTAPCVRVYEE